MSISISKPAGGVSDLAGALFKALDKDGDKTISSDEFKTFIDQLLGGQIAGSRTSTAPRAAVSAAQDETPAGFAPIQGFDYTKLTDPTHQTQKYSPAVRAFSQALYALQPNAAASRDNLGPVVEWVKQRGFPNAKAVGDDKIDFGDGVGPIDVITSSNEWWFGQPF